MIQIMPGRTGAREPTGPGVRLNPRQDRNSTPGLMTSPAWHETLSRTENVHIHWG
nr:hypothetical protein [Kibdelosporangium sp. MJ126-NF4]CTQ91934.1 hypothetical protein [Kibdelosporangium sp. MJ126-NF4]